MKNEELRTKRILRQSIRTIKASCSKAELEALSVSLLQRLEQHPAFVEARTVLLYHSLPDEVDTHAFIERWCNQKEIILPTVVGDDLELYGTRLPNPRQLWHFRAFGRTLHRP